MSEEQAPQEPEQESTEEQPEDTTKAVKATRKNRRKGSKSEGPREPDAVIEGGSKVQKLNNGRTRISYPSGLTIDK